MRSVLRGVWISAAALGCSATTTLGDASLDGAAEVGFDATTEVALDATRGDLGDAGIDATVDAPVSPWGIDARPVNRTCRAFARPAAGASVGFTRVFSGVSQGLQVVGLYRRPGDDTRWYELELSGRIRHFANRDDVSASTIFVELRGTGRVMAVGEGGLLGMAFHSRFATNGEVFLSYTGPPREGRTEALVSRVSRFRSRDGGETLDPASEEVLLEVSQPFSNHNGGNIAFGPDGYLYLGLGDGGSGGDPMRHAQNLTSLLGKFLRVDVDRTSEGRRYAIPSDNPFATGGGAPEVFAWGLRNPWRWSFDRATGDLWAGDVGQGAEEEVDLIRRGGNYGWNVREGSRCYSPPRDCPTAGFVDPVVSYGRDDGVSIAGGAVYRGAAIPWLRGHFVFGDTYSRNVWAVFDDATGRPTRRLLGAAPQGAVSFAEDQAGELYLVALTGQFFRLDPSGAAPMDTVPRSLLATGCVDPSNPLLPAEGLIPYAPNAPFWSDGAEKERYLALPEGSRVAVGADGDFDLPEGTVLVKHFTLAGRRVETRLMVRHPDGWAGYTWRWNDAQTDATLVEGSETRDVGGVRWRYPSRGECMQCHTAAAGFSLGLEASQLDGDITYPSTGRRANQLRTLEHLGVFSSALPGGLAPLPTPDGDAPLDARARAWLHTNCAQCHRPEGPGRGGLDLRYATSLASTGACDRPPTTGTLGITDARVIAPGAPERSVLLHRVRATDANRMPPISSGVVDAEGAALMERWIRALTTCP